MEIRSNAEALTTLLGVSSPGSAEAQATRRTETASRQNSLAGDQATVSMAGSEVSQSVSGTDVRMEKVSAIQQTIAAGTYSVSASDVADKLIDAMSGGTFGSHE